MSNDTASSQSTPPRPPDILRGVVERITYHNEENGYTVAKLLPERRPHFLNAWEQEVAIVGNMVGINVGESVELTGRWVIHGEYGKQFAVDRMRTVLPATAAGIEKYLGSGLIKGVGPVTAKRIVKHFAEETLTVIDEAVGRLMEVPGVGRKRVALIRTAWAEQRAIKEVMLFLQSHGVTTGLATKIYKHYGDDAIATVQRNPYQLAQDIYGIGFLTADKIAQALGMAPDAPKRVAAGAAYVLGQATDNGHVFLPSPELIREAAELLDVSPMQVADGLLRLEAEDQVKIPPSAGGEAPAAAWGISGVDRGGVEERDDFLTPRLVAEPGVAYVTITPAQVQQILREPKPVYLTPMYFSEVGVANRVRRLVSTGISAMPRFSHAPDMIPLFQAAQISTGIVLAPHQQDAVTAALTHRLTVLTGGPGTGKTTTVRTVLDLCQRAGYTVLLAAPTGRAAKRLSETTGQEAKTLHRLLEFKPTEGMAFKRNEENPLEGHLLIVDEASMLDLILTNHLLKAIAPGMHLLLVGDVDQLPSVGAGNVLQDVIEAIEGAGETGRQGDKEAGRPLANAKVVRLKTIFRQEAGSYIITNAHRINQGLMPILENDSATDFFVFRTEEPERAAQLCVELVQSRIPRRFAIPSADIQLLSPMHRGVVGVGALNEALQSALNPANERKGEKRMGSRLYRAGDRVMQIRNNYDKEVYNGDMGTILTVDTVDADGHGQL